jgi:hypothetical protein
VAWTVFARSNPIQGTDICVCVFSEFVLFSVLVAALWRAVHSSKEPCRPYEKDYGTKEEARAQQKAVVRLMNESMKFDWVNKICYLLICFTTPSEVYVLEDEYDDELGEMQKVAVVVCLTVLSQYFETSQ